MLLSILCGGRRTSRGSGKLTRAAVQVQEELPAAGLWTEIVKRSPARETFLLQGQQTVPTCMVFKRPRPSRLQSQEEKGAQGRAMSAKGL